MSITFRIDNDLQENLDKQELHQVPGPVLLSDFLSQISKNTPGSASYPWPRNWFEQVSQRNSLKLHPRMALLPCSECFRVADPSDMQEGELVQAT